MKAYILIIAIEYFSGASGLYQIPMTDLETCEDEKRFVFLQRETEPFTRANRITIDCVENSAGIQTPRHNVFYGGRKTGDGVASGR